MTNTAYLWLSMIGPIAFIGVGLTGTSWAKHSTTVVFMLPKLISYLTFGMSLATIVAVGRVGALHTALFGFSGIGFSLFLDSISGSLFVLVSFIGTVVLRYSRNYLDGDPGQAAFTKYLSMTLGFVLAFILSGNLFQTWVAWIGTSLSLHQLLTFYSERPLAILAARKKWVVSRIGDFSLFAAAALLYKVAGTLEYPDLFEIFKTSSVDATEQGYLALAGIFLVFSALIKSAQVPFHGWLLEVMETPTPVSALLHAGIINSGGFLLLRFSHLLVFSPQAMNALIIVGALTAVFGSLVLLPQTSVKTSLAYSTVAQMGFMMLECGLGMFSAAMLHLIAHSLYKAHAFLSSGRGIEISKQRLSSAESLGERRGSFTTITVLLVLISLAIASGLSTVAEIPNSGNWTLNCIFSISLITLFLAKPPRSVEFAFIVSLFLRSLGLTLLFYGLQFTSQFIFSQSLSPGLSEFTVFGVVLRGAVVLLFLVAAWIQKELLSRKDSHFSMALYTHLTNGFYINTIANRLAIKYWPAPAPRVSEPSYISKTQRGLS